MYKVYKYGNDYNLLLLDGNWVVNGHWRVYEDKEGNKWLSKKDKTPVEFVMDAPCEGDYNEILNRALEIIKERERQLSLPFTADW